jgi:hypothetical protein
VIDHPGGGGESVDERFEDGIDTRVVGEREMDAIDPLDRLRRRPEGLGAVRLEGSG